MVLSSPAKYAARLTELEALHHELETGKRPGDGAVVVVLVQLLPLLLQVLQYLLLILIMLELAIPLHLQLLLHQE